MCVFVVISQDIFTVRAGSEPTVQCCGDGHLFSCVKNKAQWIVSQDDWTFRKKCLDWFANYNGLLN